MLEAVIGNTVDGKLLPEREHIHCLSGFWKKISECSESFFGGIQEEICGECIFYNSFHN